jgi:glycerate kinase
MKVLIAPDKFKGSLTAIQACEAIRDGVLLKYPGAEVHLVPLADGGEGTCELLTLHTGGQMITEHVAGPRFEKVQATYGLSDDGRTAFIDSAKASGLVLLPNEKRDPRLTTTLGTGELIANALSHGASIIVLGIGGTATNDAGIGMAATLGYKFLDASNRMLEPVGKNLRLISAIDPSGALKLLQRATFVALCDVNNPLYGPRGAAFTYAPQKGASPEVVDELDLGLRNFEAVVMNSLQLAADFPGAGAGGGLASGAKVFLNASIRRGMDYIMDVTHLEEKIRRSDLVITGEGKIDTQTLSGKVVGTVSAVAQRAGKTVVAVCGVCELREIELSKMGISRVITLTDPFTDADQAMRNAGEIVRRRVAEEA